MELQNLDDLIRGDTLSILIELTGEDDSVIDVTGFVVRFTVKAHRGLTDAEAEIRYEQTVPSSVAAQAGQISIEIPATDTTNLDPITYWYDIEIDDGLSISTIGIGKVRVVEDVTRGA